MNLQGGPAVAPPSNHPNQTQHGGYQGGSPLNGGQQHQGAYPGNQQHQNQGQQQNDNNNEGIEKIAKKLLPKVIKKLEGCCVVM